jgi:hypothetical protein
MQWLAIFRKPEGALAASQCWRDAFSGFARDRWRERANVQHVIDQFEAVIADDLQNSFLNVGIVKFNDLPRVHADDVIVLVAIVQFKNRFAAFEVMALE